MAGRGGLSLSHGGIELLSRSNPSRSIAQLSAPHPYSLAGKKNLVAGLKSFSEITESQELPFKGGISSNQHIFTASGRSRPLAYTPPGYLNGDMQKFSNPITLGTFNSLRDFQADFALCNQDQHDSPIKNIVALPLLHPFTKRDLYPLDAARLLDDLDWTIENARAWKPHLVGAKWLGLPAILGIARHLDVLEILQDMLSIPVFEIPTLPPSVPGLRLEHALHNYAELNGTQFIEGPNATGRVQHQPDGVRVAGVLLNAAGRQYAINCKDVILATGSFLHGGLKAGQNHKIIESVFNLPVDYQDDRSNWVGKKIFEAQTYSTFGVSVNNAMQPLDIHDEPMFDNLYAVGGILRGADRTLEVSRQGIDIATSHCAVEHLTRSVS